MTASPEAILERRHKAGRADRWSGIVLALLMFAALALAARHIWTIATGPLPPGPGVAAPAFHGSTVDGEPFDLASLQGKVVLLDFWATWCPPCVASMPHLQNLQDELGAKGLVVVGVNQEPGEEFKVKRFLIKRNLTFRSVMDPGSIHVGYGVFSFPTSFVIDRQGVIRASFRGPASEGQLRRAIEDAL